MDNSFNICSPATSFEGKTNNETITGSFESGKFEGHYFFNGDWVQAKLLNYFQQYERTLKSGLRSNRRVKTLLEFYEWIPSYGTKRTIEHFGVKSFNQKLTLFKEAGFSDEFINIIEDYTPISCPLFRQWTFLFTFNKRPLIMLD